MKIKISKKIIALFVAACTCLVVSVSYAAVRQVKFRHQMGVKSKTRPSQSKMNDSCEADRIRFRTRRIENRLANRVLLRIEYRMTVSC